MKIALINENSQAAKNPLILGTLEKVVKPMGYEVFNYGMNGPEDTSITYVQNGIIAAVLLNTHAVDFVITGCGTGVGAMLALNSFPGIVCGLASDPADAFMFTQINNGNALSIPFAKGFGWGGELNLQYLFEKLFSSEWGNGYPPERKVPENRNAAILCDVRKNAFHDLETILKSLDKDLVKGAFSTEGFKKSYKANAQDTSLFAFIDEITK
jgi:ribose 5-phosphate isomerase RpiB